MYRDFTAGIIFLASILLALYVAIFWGIIEPILNIADAIDTDTISTGMIVREFLKFFIREILAVTVFAVGTGIATFVAESKI